MHCLADAFTTMNPICRPIDPSLIASNNTVAATLPLTLWPVTTYSTEPASYATVKLISQNTANIDAAGEHLNPIVLPRGRKPVTQKQQCLPPTE